LAAINATIDSVFIDKNKSEFLSKAPPVNHKYSGEEGDSFNVFDTL